MRSLLKVFFHDNNLQFATMDRKLLEFDVIVAERNQLRAEIVFIVKQWSSIVQKISVGQSIKSGPFTLDFPASIGKSKWNLLLFPNGQYENGRSNDTLAVYLKLLQCERQSAELNFHVTVGFGDENANVERRNQRICFENAKTRWIGIPLINVNELIADEDRFVQRDTMILSVRLEEIFSSDDEFDLPEIDITEPRPMDHSLTFTGSERVPYADLAYENFSLYNVSESVANRSSFFKKNFIFGSCSTIAPTQQRIKRASLARAIVISPTTNFRMTMRVTLIKRTNRKAS